MGTAVKLIGCSEAGGRGLADVRAVWPGGRQRLDWHSLLLVGDGNLPVLLNKSFQNYN